MDLSFYKNQPTPATATRIKSSSKKRKQTKFKTRYRCKQIKLRPANRVNKYMSGELNATQIHQPGTLEIDSLRANDRRKKRINATVNENLETYPHKTYFNILPLISSFYHCMSKSLDDE